MILYELFRVTEEWFDVHLTWLGVYSNLNLAKEKLEYHLECAGESTHECVYYSIMETTLDNPDGAKRIYRWPEIQ